MQRRSRRRGGVWMSSGCWYQRPQCPCCQWIPCPCHADDVGSSSSSRSALPSSCCPSRRGDWDCRVVYGSTFSGNNHPMLSHLYYHARNSAVFLEMLRQLDVCFYVVSSYMKDSQAHEQQQIKSAWSPKEVESGYEFTAEMFTPAISSEVPKICFNSSRSSPRLGDMSNFVKLMALIMTPTRRIQLNMLSAFAWRILVHFGIDVGSNHMGIFCLCASSQTVCRVETGKLPSTTTIWAREIRELIFRKFKDEK